VNVSHVCTTLDVLLLLASAVNNALLSCNCVITSDKFATLLHKPVGMHAADVRDCDVVHAESDAEHD
jgi:hypothetical protein